MTPVSADQIVAELRDLVKQHPNDKAAAKAIKCTPSQLSCTLNNRNNVIPERILKALGYTSQLAYFKAGEVPKAKKSKTAKKTLTPKPAAATVKGPKKATAAPKDATGGVRRVGVRRVGVQNEAIRNEDAATNFISLKD